jgi:succinate-acetate transporter protein
MSGAAGRSAQIVLRPIANPLPLGFLARDVAAGTGMGILAGTWASIALVTLTSPPGATSDALGLFLLLAATAMLVPAASAALGKLVPAAVLTTAALRFATTGVFEITGSSAWKHVAGIVGLVLCGLAIYAAAAMALEDVRNKTTLPVGRHGSGADAMDSRLDAQLTAIEREAGVRAQL